jgi:serine/threonine-protein kinase
LVVVAALIVGGVLAFGGDPGPGPTPTTNAEPTTDALPTTSAEPRPTTGTTAGEQLLAILPGDVDPGSCSAQALAGDGDLAALGCGPALTQPGPLTTQFNLYPAGGVDGVFQGDVEAVALAEFGPGQQCPDYLGYGGYNQNGQVRGRVACGVGQGNASYLLWTDDEFAAEALVTIPNGGGQGIYTLWNWFVDPGHSAFGP